MVDTVAMEPETVLKEEGDWYPDTGVRLRPTSTLLSPRPFPACPPSTSCLPSTVDWPGSHHLQLEVEDSGNWRKRGFAYSPALHKLYIDTEKQVAVRVCLKSPPPPGCIVRVLPVYMELASRTQPVLRCPVHSAPEDPSNHSVPRELHRHLIRSAEPTARYCEDSSSGRLSVTVAVKDQEPGCNFFSLFYQFLCLGSCVGGLARRQLQVVFTLETGQGQVLGRRALEVRICSCPLRDMKQDEAKAEKLLTRGPGPRNGSPSGSCGEEKREGGEEVYWVPVRGLDNFETLDRFAEFLELRRGEGLGEEEKRLRRERRELVSSRNLGLRQKGVHWQAKRKMEEEPEEGLAGKRFQTMQHLNSSGLELGPTPCATTATPVHLLAKQKHGEGGEETDGEIELLKKIAGEDEGIKHLLYLS